MSRNIEKMNVTRGIETLDSTFGYCEAAIWLYLLTVSLCVLIAAYFIYLYLISKRVGIVSKNPIFENHYRSFHLFKNPPLQQIKVYCDWSKKKNWSSKRLKSILKPMYMKHDMERTPIPENTRILCIKVPPFEFGNKPHEFVPKEGAAPTSFLTYRTIGRKRAQATYYNEGGKAYFAGICIFILSPNVMGIEYDKDLIHKFLHNERRYTGRNIAKEETVRRDEEGNFILEKDKGVVLMDRNWMTPKRTVMVVDEDEAEDGGKIDETLILLKYQKNNIDESWDLEPEVEPESESKSEAESAKKPEPESDPEQEPEPKPEKDQEIQSEHSFDLCESKSSKSSSVSLISLV